MEEITLRTIKFYRTRSISGWLIYISGYAIVMMLGTSSTKSTNDTMKKFKWVDFNNRFDCIVGISVNGVPVSSGILISNITVITSANAIERVSKSSHVKVHTIDGNPKKEKIRDVWGVARDQCKRNTVYWKTFGFDGQHSPVHDVLMITLKAYVTNARTPSRRQPYINEVIKVKSFESTGMFSFAGFGFIDKSHVRSNFELEPVEYMVEKILANCDEWIPRSWGIYICLDNNEHFVGISSGAGLFYNDVLVGIGSFTVTKGNESVLVFTDLRSYKNRLFFIPRYRKKKAG